MCEASQVEDSCLLNLQEVVGILMEFFKEELVQLHEINAKKGKYAYSLNLAKYLKKLKALLYQTKSNLLRRYVSENKKLQQGVIFPGATVAASSAFSSKLRVAILELEKIILLFYEY